MCNVIETRKCYLYVLNTMADWEIGYITAELKSGRFLLNNEKFEIIPISSKLESIETMGGIVIEPVETIINVEFRQNDLLILPGSDTWMDENNNQVLDMIPDLLKRNVIVAAICGATIALAKKGILENLKHTSNDKNFLKMMCPDYAGESFYIEEPAITDGNLITASGLAPLEFSYQILQKLNVMKKDTLYAWYQLNLTKKSKWFFSLLESMK
ncbi:MAG: glutamine amidotransferase [Candidatus Delongbacteria bacterium]|nr:glutamine amidotransferase [Candidatus Delongbacteria bacterium]MBN2834847.1 glutamine amidotransferase [Candidatus Delongbacteria bacterium]